MKIKNLSFSFSKIYTKITLKLKKNKNEKVSFLPFQTPAKKLPPSQNVQCLLSRGPALSFFFKPQSLPQSSSKKPIYKLRRAVQNGPTS